MLLLLITFFVGLIFYPLKSYSQQTFAINKGSYLHFTFDTIEIMYFVQNYVGPLGWKCDQNPAIQSLVPYVRKEGVVSPMLTRVGITETHSTIITQLNQC